jgi:hypothetical protein
MGQMNLEGGTLRSFFIDRQFKLRSFTFTMTGALTITADHPPMLFLDANGAARTLTLPAEADSDGLVFFLKNTAAGAFAITVEDDATGTVAVCAQNEGAILMCDGTTWQGLVGTET